MERTELYSQLEQKLSENWNAYMDELLPLPPIQIIGKAQEIAATRSCYEELAWNAASCPKRYLENLLGFDDPLEVLREKCLDEQCSGHSGAIERALLSLVEPIGKTIKGGKCVEN